MGWLFRGDYKTGNTCSFLPLDLIAASGRAPSTHWAGPRRAAEREEWTRGDMLTARAHYCLLESRSSAIFSDL